jgi:hypothetical protein
MRELLQRAMADLERLGHVNAENSGDLKKLMQMSADDAPPHCFYEALADMARWCHASIGEPAVILIDEYDAPLHAAWEHGYWDEAVTFFRHFLATGFKDNPHLFKGVMTGILKVAKEGIFSGLNHIETASILTDSFNNRFGFTEPEVVEFAACSGLSENLASMQRWYNGYSFGETKRETVYNPWSVLSYLKTPGLGPKTFWKNTSDNALIRELLMRHADTMGSTIEALIAGDSVTQVIDESVALQHLHDAPDAVISLVLFSGYLTTESVTATRDGLLATLRIPNLDVRSVYAETFSRWLARSSAQNGLAGLGNLTSSLLRGEAATFERELGALLKNGMSAFDFGHRPVEAIYQAFVVGLLLSLEDTHIVRSNRESGFGRADVLIKPRSAGPGAVLELKVIDTEYQETREQALDRAVAQLVDREYASEVRAAGATVVHQYAVVFDGKRCWARMVAEPT